LEERRWRYLGGFAEVLGVRPWEMDLLTMPEFLGLCDYLDQREEAMKAD
jgi:hypothetical protein